MSTPWTKIFGHVHFVVFEEGDVAAQLVIVAKIQDFMDEIAARFVGGMGFPGEDKLDRPPLVLQQPLQSFEVLEEQGGALVGRESSGKSDRQGFRIEQRAAAQHL